MNDIIKQLMDRGFRRITSESRLDDYAELLEAWLDYNIEIGENGEPSFYRQQVDKVGPLKIEIFAREHAPPHFHVRSANLDATFRIDNCAVLSGNVPPAQQRKVRVWHSRAKNELAKQWNATRPANCPVGKVEIAPEEND